MRSMGLGGDFAYAWILLCICGLSDSFSQELSKAKTGGVAPSSVIAPVPLGAVNALDYGLVNDPSCSIDATASLNAAIAAAAGRKLVLPSGTFCLNTAASTLKIAATTEIQGQGASTIIQWNAPNGSPAAPVIDVLASAKDTIIHDLSVDALPAGSSYTTPTYFGTNPWGGVALVIEGDGFRGYNLWATEGYNNCIGIGAMDNNDIAITGSPRFVILDNIHTSQCGSGNETVGPIPGHSGAGIDNGSGGGAIISNAIDIQSYSGFENDLGGGAFGTWSNIISFNAKADPQNVALHGSGIGFYNFSPFSTFSNVSIFDPGSYGIWNDFYAFGSLWSNVVIKGSQTYCVYFKGPATFNGLQCADSSMAGSGLYPALLIDTSGGAWPQSLMVNNYTVSGQNHSFAVQATGANNITGLVTGGPMSGVRAAYSIPSSISGLQIVSQSSKGVGFGSPAASYPWDFLGAFRAQASTGNASWKNCPYGDNICPNGGNVYIADFASPGKRLGMGYDPVNDLFVFQSIQAGVLPKPLALNPSGGSVQIGQQSLPSNASSGFPYIPATAGAPTGVPEAVTGMVPMQYDRINHKFWIYDGGWKSVTVN
ncbi:hypothetical protein FBZ99_101593 [Rhizobium sp. ERR 1071]|nr:hypothetical protein FBZ99_101593 [Rhizobium sp. ERR1071]